MALKVARMFSAFKTLRDSVWRRAAPVALEVTVAPPIVRKPGRG
jgi:hypothetical protein